VGSRLCHAPSTARRAEPGKAYGALEKPVLDPVDEEALVISIEPMR